jgi:hypothetical protein
MKRFPIISKPGCAQMRLNGRAIVRPGCNEKARRHVAYLQRLPNKGLVEQCCACGRACGWRIRCA